MVDQHQACRLLSITPTGLVDLINRAELAAYDLGGAIRFRYHDVTALARALLGAEPAPA